MCNIMAINICSVQKHFDELCTLLDNTSVEFDIIILVESWLGRVKININVYQLPNYSLCHTRLNKNQNDGVMVFTRNSLIIVFTLELQSLSHTALEIQNKKMKY